MDKRNYSNLADQIRSSVESAMNTMDFGQLNRDISNSVNSALNDVRNHLRGQNGPGPYDTFGQNGPGSFYNNGPNQGPNPGAGYQQDMFGRQRYENRQRSTRHQNQNNTTYYKDAAYQTYQKNNFQFKKNNMVPKSNYYGELTPYVSRKPVGKISGVVMQIFGYTGTGVFGIAVFVLTILSLSNIAANVLSVVAAGLFPLFGLSLALGLSGRSSSRRVKRFYAYCEAFHGKRVCKLEDLAAAVGKSVSATKKDINKMIRLGMFREAFFDKQDTCMILGNDMYQQYINTQMEYQERIKEEQMKAKESKETQGKDNSELAQTIREGREYIQKIKSANDAIPGEEISNKLYRLETITSKIFRCVEEHPDQLPELRKFMEYYLPTTLKLLNAYQEFDAQPIQGENITQAKEEIGKTIDTINLAFEKLLDSLYKDAAMEVSTDISVLETLLAQEGLTKKDFDV